MSGVCGTADRRLCHTPTTSYDEAKRKQTATREAGKVGAHVAITIAKEVVAEATGHGIEALAEGVARGRPPRTASAVRNFGKGAPLLAMAHTSVDVTVMLKNIVDMSHAAGKELNDALAGQNQDVAILMIAAQADPGSVDSGYLAHRAAVVGATRFRHVSFRLATEVTSLAAQGDSRAVELRDVLVRDFNAGRTEAYSRDIRSQTMLDLALEDPGFRHSYDDDPAFRQGVLAAMDQATRDCASFESEARVIASQRYWSTTRP